MGLKKINKKKLQTKLLHKYRLVVLNEDTFEERFAVKLTRLNVFSLSSLAAIILIILTTLLIVLTPLREYIPGYSSAALQKQALNLSYKTDSLIKAINMNDLYIKSIKSALSGEVSSVVINKDSIFKAAQADTDVFELIPSAADSILREKVSREDKYNLFKTAISSKDFVFFPPVNGPLSAGFDSKVKHYAVDIVTPINTPVKSTSDGRVIFTSWTSEAGYVIIIDHGDELISVYKHNSSLTKSQGEIVKSREVIAISGGSGELSTGPHLHFELWSNGVPLNPANFMDF
ncbi:M23 family metallopeptidase [Flavobacteriaceae bacterium]|jgi:murein DD-endopeptidase MepM/ murein hydrolase activator NlpD|nr:M23 family metallopeptidase [Flavobacteriaceae bacterium]MDC0463030.1 M23 family metallopeptidase [Flavobacteriaceae bacterium]MDC3198511.1 M23 family metallopeptidase [Flavobacteriaceae bacterium]MDC3350380.1 M23 family metallopeptidase [Flavobacteriaceae bacterium]